MRFMKRSGNPVRGVHVVRAAALVPGVDAELEEVLDIVVPGLEVGAPGAAPLATLVHGDELVVVQLEERNDALGFPVGALNVATGAANGGPGPSESLRPTCERKAFSAMPRCMMDSIESSTL